MVQYIMYNFCIIKCFCLNCEPIYLSLQHWVREQAPDPPTFNLFGLNCIPFLCHYNTGSVNKSLTLTLPPFPLPLQHWLCEQVPSPLTFKLNFSGLNCAPFLCYYNTGSVNKYITLTPSTFLNKLTVPLSSAITILGL